MRRRHVTNAHVESVCVVHVGEAVLTRRRRRRHRAGPVEGCERAGAARQQELVMESVVPDLGDPVPAMIVLEGQDRAIGLSDVPDSDGTI